jgi:hypothetical protein
MADKKVFKIGNKVALYLEPPDLPRPKGKKGLSKTSIWVERRDFYGGLAVPKVSPNSKGEEGKKPKKAKKAKVPEDYLILGFDTEFVAPPRLTLKEIREGISKQAAGVGKNQILSYQFAAIGPKGEKWSGIACTDTDDGVDARLSFGEFIVFALGSGLRSGAIKSLHASRFHRIQ